MAPDNVKPADIVEVELSPLKEDSWEEAERSDVDNSMLVNVEVT